MTDLVNRDFRDRTAALAIGIMAALLITILAVPTAMAQQEEVELGPSGDVFTQEDADIVLTLQDAIDLALERSFTVYELKQQFLQANYLLENARRQLRTRIDFNSTLPGINQSITPDLVSTGGGGQELVFLRDSSKWLYGGLDIVQPLITNGRIVMSGEIVGFDAFRKIPALPQVDARSVQPSIGVQFNQPLFQYNQVRGALLDARLSLESLDLSYTEDELQRINQVSRQFYSLFAQQSALELANERYELSERNYASGVRRLNAGLLAETDVMRLDVTRMNDLDALESTRNQLEQAQFAFNRMVGLPLDQKVWAKASIDEYRPIEVDLDRALQLSFDNRSDLRRAEITGEQLELSLRQQRSMGRPDLQLNVGYDLTGNSSLTAGPDDRWQHHIGESLNTDNRSPNTNITLNLRIPLFDWGRNASLVQRLVSQSQVVDRQIEEVRQDLVRTVTDRVRSVENAMLRLSIQEKNILIAQTSYDFTVRKFDRGEITSVELAQALDQLSRTQTNRLTALIEFELAKADLKEITLWDWETNQPVRRRTEPPQPFERRRNR